MSGEVICEKDGDYIFVEMYSKKKTVVRGDKLIDHGEHPYQNDPHLFEVKHGDQTVARLQAFAWWFEELPDQL